MEYRNLKRRYYVKKGLRIYHKSKGGVRLTDNDVLFLLCFQFRDTAYTASVFHKELDRDGHCFRAPNVYKRLKRLKLLGLVDRDDKLRYWLSALGRVTLGEVEKCVKRARSDR